LLINLQRQEILADYFLVGGTALSLQLGHRMSVDIDLFTRSAIDKEEILGFLNTEYGGDCQIHNMRDTVLQVNVSGINVDFLRHDYRLIEEIKSENGIRLLGIKDIAAMKLMAIANRGDQAKDFVDVFYLLREMSLSDMFECYKQKYSQSDISAIKRSLVYFDDVTESSWAAVKLSEGSLSADDVRRVIREEVLRYSS
jgi:predicted nucleotidyltransferase component of viral defense system